MTRECLGDPLVPAEVARLVVDRADGLPFFVELLAGLQSDGTLVREDGGWIAHRPRGRAPATFRESIRQRVSGLDDEARAVVGDAALLGRWIEPALLIEITGATPAAVDATIADAVGRSLMEVHELGVRFRHALIRDALLADMAPFARAQRSREVLAALRSARPELPGISSTSPPSWPRAPATRTRPPTCSWAPGDAPSPKAP